MCFLLRIFNPFLNETNVSLASESRDEETSDNVSIAENVTDIAPIADRLLIFWSDVLVHSVLASFAPAGNANAVCVVFIFTC